MGWSFDTHTPTHKLNHFTIERKQTMKNNIGPVCKPLFYRSSPKNIVPVCLVDVISWFHPHVRFHGYVSGSKECKDKATQGLPFFTDNFGPKWTEFTTTAHEQLPGHQLEAGAFQRSPTNWLNFSKGEKMVGALAFREDGMRRGSVVANRVWRETIENQLLIYYQRPGWAIIGNCRALRGDQINFTVTAQKSADATPPRR